MIERVCMHCHHSNLEDAKFCIECGAGLVRRPCPNCHVANDLHARFCLDCGARLPEPELPLMQPWANVQAPSIGHVPHAVVATFAPVQPMAAVTARGTSGTVIPDTAPARRGSSTALRVAVGAAALLSLGLALWVFKAPSPVVGASALPQRTSSGQVGADAVNPSVAVRPESVTPANTAAPPTPPNAGAPATTAAERSPTALPTAASGEAARAPTRPVSRERAAASPAVPAPPPIAPRPAPVFVCTPNVQALGLCNPTP